MNESEFEPIEASGNVIRDFDDPLPYLKQSKSFLTARMIAVLDACEISVRMAGMLTRCASADFSCISNANLVQGPVNSFIYKLELLKGRIGRCHPYERL